MLIGLVTDIHDDVEHLASALDLFRQRGVDHIVTLGDSCDAFTRHSRAAEVVEHLRQANAVGVWGNHDFGLCHNVDERTRGRYPAAVLDFMATMKPSLVLADCHFSHRGPAVDPYDALALWAFDGDGELSFAALTRRSLGAVAQRLLFIGHYHRWLAATADGPVDWPAGRPLRLAGPERLLVVVGAVFQGQCGLFDTQSCEMVPLSC